MIKKFKVELILLVVVFLNIFISYNIDVGLFNLFNDFDRSLQQTYFKKIFKQITVLGDSKWYFAISIIGLVLYFLNKKFNLIKNINYLNYIKKISIFLFFSQLVTGAITQVLKHLVGRPRPNHTDFETGIGFNFLSLDSGFHSFPSGHSSTIFCAAIILSYFLPKIKYFLILVAGVVAFSRVVVGAHFLTDIVGGIVIAFIGVKIVKIILERYFNYYLVFDNIKIQKNKLFLSMVVSITLMIFVTAGPSIDIYLSGIFYYGNGQFLLQSFYLITIVFRKILLPIIIVYIFFLPILSMILPIKTIYFGHHFRVREIVFIWVSGFINLLIVVNLFFKNLWGRARPNDIFELGGKESFSYWYEISTSCERNCSFVSGDASVGFSLICIYFLTKKIFFFWASLLIGSSIGIIRMMEGGHFFSDIVMAMILIFLLYFYQIKFYGKNAH